MAARPRVCPLVAYPTARYAVAIPPAATKRNMSEPPIVFLYNAVTTIPTRTPSRTNAAARSPIGAAVAPVKAARVLATRCRASDAACAIHSIAAVGTAA